MICLYLFFLWGRDDTKKDSLCPSMLLLGWLTNTCYYTTTHYVKPHHHQEEKEIVTKLVNSDDAIIASSESSTLLVGEKEHPQLKNLASVFSTHSLTIAYWSQLAGMCRTAKWTTIY